MPTARKVIPLYAETPEEKTLRRIDRVLNDYFLFINGTPYGKWNAYAKKCIARIRRIDQLAAAAGRLIQDEIRELSG